MSMSAAIQYLDNHTLSGNLKEKHLSDGVMRWTNYFFLKKNAYWKNDWLLHQKLFLLALAYWDFVCLFLRMIEVSESLPGIQTFKQK